MTAIDSKKLQKALDLMEKANLLIDAVETSDKKFNHSSNSNFRKNRVRAALDIMKSEVREFCK